MAEDALPGRFQGIAGALPAAGRLDPELPYPFGTLNPTREGTIDRDGVKLWYAVWGDSGPWLAFAPPFQIVHTGLLKATVPWLSQHFRVLTLAKNSGKGAALLHALREAVQSGFTHVLNWCCDRSR